MSDDETRMKTLWTQTLFDDLYGALKRGKSDSELRTLLKDLKDKEMPLRYVVKKVNDEVGPQHAKRLEAILAGKATAAAGKGKTVKGKTSGGVLGSIKGLFK